MSTEGYNGRDFLIKTGSPTPTAIAAVTTKSATRNREPVDVTTDDDDGNRRLLPMPGTRSLDVSVEGVVTANNWSTLREMADSDTFADITIENPDGTTETADDGFFLTSLEWTGEQSGSVTFTASLQSSGPITITPAP